MFDDAGSLIHFTHEVDGRLHPGWFRRIPGRRIEVFTLTRVKIVFIESDPVEVDARRALEDLIHLDWLDGEAVGFTRAPRKRK
jgi:hypothetical protein